MTPLLFRPFIPKVTAKNTNMLDPHQNSSHQTTPDFSTVQISSVEKNTLSKNYRDVSAITGRKSLKSCVREDKECLVTSHKKVPKIVLHRTHPPHLSMHRGLDPITIDSSMIMEILLNKHSMVLYHLIKPQTTNVDALIVSVALRRLEKLRKS